RGGSRRFGPASGRSRPGWHPPLVPLPARLLGADAPRLAAAGLGWRAGIAGPPLFSAGPVRGDLPLPPLRHRAGDAAEPDLRHADRGRDPGLLRRSRRRRVPLLPPGRRRGTLGLGGLGFDPASGPPRLAAAPCPAAADRPALLP